MMKMLGKVKEMQSKMAELQESLSTIFAEGESGGGMVVAKANGKKQLISLHIEKDLLQPEEVDMLQDLVVAAVNKALENAEEQAKEYLKKQTEGLFPNIPGIDLSGLMR
ncbi:MAG: YbaB/EbfC family nucleoid-associated protein [Cytophagales bacterium]|nr:YbaB/EbfC family nucleoid-associated protein [Cytophagales bacterium]